MNYRMVFYILGQIIRAEGLFLGLAFLCALVYGETGTYLSFLAPILLTVGFGTALTLKKPRNRDMHIRDGFVSVGLSWIVLSLFGMLPFLLSGVMASPMDAFFETVSGFTTTGATILTEIESLPRGILFWRSLTHWVGGMGILVFVLAVMPQADLTTARLMNVMRAEVPGPKVGKMVPTLKKTARITYGIYIALTALNILLLALGDMSLYEAMIHGFGTAGTGGFSCLNDSYVSYSPYSQWVTTVFMVLFGLNFNLYFLLLIGRAKQAFRSEEFWTFLALVGASSLAIALNIRHLYGSLEETLRHAFFQVSTILSTTGYATTDFNLWPHFSRTLLFLLLFAGACAGSTAGGLKISRIILLAKTAVRELRYLLHPRAVQTIRFEGKPVDNETVRSSMAYFVFYAGIYAASVLLFGLTDGMGLEASASAIATALNNVGPGMGDMLGPMGNFASVTVAGKLLLSFNMLLGRLEIFPILLLFFPSTWRNR